MRLALYRKYRPKNFEELMGQDVIQGTLLASLQQGRMVHAYLFSGPRGTGKTSTARLLAKAIQCKNPQENGEACNACEICGMNDRQELIDLIEIDAASNRGIEDIRDLREKIRFAPSYASKKVYIIDEVHMLTKEAFNALLKSLEEPPEHVFFILATTEIHKIPETILSRCQHYAFRRIPHENLVQNLKKIADLEGMEIELGALDLIADRAQGGMRDALTLLEQLGTEKISEERIRDHLGLHANQNAQKLIELLLKKDGNASIHLIGQIHQEGHDLLDFTAKLIQELQKRLHQAMREGKTEEVKQWSDWIQDFDTAWLKQKSTSIATLPLELTIAQIIYGPFHTHRRV